MIVYSRIFRCQQFYWRSLKKTSATFRFISSILLDNKLFFVIMQSLIEMKLIAVIKLIISIAICLGASIIGSFLTTPAIPTWYANLKKPFFTPPNWLFAPVWTILFILMGVALFLIWHKGLDSTAVKTALVIFFLQLMFNISWSASFFAFRSPLAGLIVIVILWIAILLTIMNFYRISMVAGVLLIPYILWVSFAAVLNFALFTLNR